MDNIKFNSEDYKNLFGKFDYFTLETLDKVLYFALNHDNEDLNKAFEMQYYSKYKDALLNGELEGRNELIYYYNLNEIAEKIDLLSEEEIVLLKSISEDSLSNFPNDYFFKNLKSEITNTLDIINDKLNSNELIHKTRTLKR